jgi:hypothetical protein
VTPELRAQLPVDEAAAERVLIRRVQVCTNPGSEISSLRTAPPSRSDCSSTSVRQPARASSTAATSP